VVAIISGKTRATIDAVPDLMAIGDGSSRSLVISARPSLLHKACFHNWRHLRRTGDLWFENGIARTADARELYCGVELRIFIIPPEAGHGRVCDSP
jgi:hypothetical protein